MIKLISKIQDLKAHGRYRSLQSAQGIDLTSNDYLGMRAHPALRVAALEALEAGMEVGAGGSRLLRGHMDEHAQLEDFAARYFGAGGALFFATGFQANYALFTTLPSRHDVIIFDELVHASVRDGIKASNAKSIKVPHNDLDGFKDALKRVRARNEESIIWLAVESVYSMDGDLAPLKELYKLAQQYGAILIVDEAHGTGIFGENGRGLSEGLDHENVITLHTCGKAIGVAGGLICASKTIIDTLINTARPFIYSTAPPPLQAHLVQKSLEILAAEPQRRARLFELIEYSKTIFSVSNIRSQIIPFIIGDDAAAVKTAAKLQNEGFDVRAIRPPTVPEGTARLRISLSTNLDEKTLDEFANALNACMEKKAA